MKQHTSMNFSRPRRRLTTSSKTPKKKGNLFPSRTSPKFSFFLLTQTYFRQRKLKEAREAADQEVSRYRQAKEAEFERMKERVSVPLFARKKIGNSKPPSRGRPNRKSLRSRKTLKGTKTRSSKCSSIKSSMSTSPSPTQSRRSSLKRDDFIPVNIY